MFSRTPKLFCRSDLRQFFPVVPLQQCIQPHKIEALFPDPREPGCNRIHRRRTRMTDGNRLASCAGNSFGLVHPGLDFLGVRFVVQKYVAHRIGYAGIDGGGRADRPAACAGIEEKQTAFFKFRYDDIHLRPVPGERTAHMVVYAGIPAEAAENFTQLASQFCRGGRDRQDVDTRFSPVLRRFHRQMKYHRMPFQPRTADLGRDFRCEGKICQRDLRRQAQSPRGIDPVETHVVYDNRDPRPRRALGAALKSPWRGRAFFGRDCSGRFRCRRHATNGLRRGRARFFRRGRPRCQHQGLRALQRDGSRPVGRSRCRFFLALRG